MFFLLLFPFFLIQSSFSTKPFFSLLRKQRFSIKSPLFSAIALVIPRPTLALLSLIGTSFSLLHLLPRTIDHYDRRPVGWVPWAYLLPAPAILAIHPVKLFDVPLSVGWFIYFFSCQHEPYYLQHLVGCSDDSLLVPPSASDPFVE